MCGNIIEHSVDFFRKFFTVFGNFLSYHLDSAKRADASLKRFICLKTNDDVLTRYDISRLESINSHDSACVNL